MYDMEKEERVLDNLEIYVKYDKPITREQAEETIDFIMELENKIDELVKNQCKENKRLNNIIDELEKYLFKQLQLYGGGGIVQEYYDKLQELKEKQ